VVRRSKKSVKKYYELFFLVAVVLILHLVLSPCFSGEELWARGRESTTSPELAVFLVVDVSGSMARTDPGRLREVASRMFIDLLGEEDYLGVMVFDHRAELVTPLQQVKSTARRETIKEELTMHMDPRGATDFKGALEAVFQEFENTDLGGREPMILMLTDGEPNPEPDRREDEKFMENYLASLWEVADTLGSKKIPVYTAGFSDEIDPEIIAKLSDRSGGSYYILQEPVDLLVTFFEILGELKNRQLFLEETEKLENTTRSYDFTVDGNMRQVNLVTVSPAGEAEASVLPPRGAPEDLNNLSISEGENYNMITLAYPPEEQYGTWEIEIHGEGEIQVIGQKDQYIRAFIVEPSPFSQHPLGEPVHFKAGVSLPENYKNVPLQVKVEVTTPGNLASTVVDLKRVHEEEGYYRGTYENTKKQGEYQLLLHVLAEEEKIFTSATSVYVDPVPILTTDFWGTDRVFPRGEELVMNAALEFGGERLREGATLKVEKFRFLLDNEEEDPVVIDLHDSGDPKHGNIRANDGIWSNRMILEAEGTTEALLLASGVYRDKDFLLEKNLGSIQVMPPGAVTIDRTYDELWSVAGDSFRLPLVVENHSSFDQELNISLSGGSARLLQGRFPLKPGENNKIRLPVEMAQELKEGLHRLELDFSLERELTEIAPEQMDFQVEMLSPGAAALRRLHFWFTSAGWGVLGLMVVGGGFYVGGISLNRFYLCPRLRVGGFLCYRNNEGNRDRSDQFTHFLKLRKAKKQQIVITFNPHNSGADFYLANSAYEHDLIIKNRWNEHLTPCLRGWKALFGPPLNVETLAECTPPGVVESNGVICTVKELYHQDEFETGGMIFQYYHVHGNWSRENSHGKDVLERKLTGKEGSYHESL